MHQLAIQWGLWVALLAAQILLIGSLVRKGLAKRYPFFVLYLAADAIWGVALIQIDYRTPAYSFSYRIYLIVDCVLQLGAAGELFERICEHFHGIGTFRFYMYAWMAGIAALLSFLSFRPDLMDQWGFPHTLPVWIERFVLSSLCGALVLTRLFLHNFLYVRPLIRPNVLRHWTLLVCYFGVIVLGFSAFLLVQKAALAIQVINLAILAGQLACVLIWMRVMTPEGERVPKVYPEGLERRAELRKELLEFADGRG